VRKEKKIQKEKIFFLKINFFIFLDCVLVFLYKNNYKKKTFLFYEVFFFLQNMGGGGGGGGGLPHKKDGGACEKF